MELAIIFFLVILCIVIAVKFLEHLDYIEEQKFYEDSHKVAINYYQERLDKYVNYTRELEKELEDYKVLAKSLEKENKKLRRGF